MNGRVRRSQVAHSSITSTCNSPQTDVLMLENERLRRELEVYMEKAARLQKVSGDTTCLPGLTLYL